MTDAPPKYTTEELQRMALHALEAKHDDPLRYLELVARLVMRTGLDPRMVEAEIHRLAMG